MKKKFLAWCAILAIVLILILLMIFSYVGASPESILGFFAILIIFPVISYGFYLFKNKK